MWVLRNDPVDYGDLVRLEIDTCAPKRHEVVVQVSIPRIGGDGSEIERFGRPDGSRLEPGDRDLWLAARRRAISTVLLVVPFAHDTDQVG